MNMLVILVTLLVSTASFAERINAENDPNNFNKSIGTQMVTAIDELPLEGKLNDSRLGWSETYWPSNKGGIAYRWNHPNPQPFKYKFMTKDELKAMSEAQLAQLSPAELYDIATNDYNYSLTKKLLSLYKPSDLWWEGICHGWSLAASNYPEPKPVVVRNKDGINVPFGSSDVKGLLAAHDAYNSTGTYSMVGGRCAVTGKVPGEGDSRDPNPNPPTAEDANTDKCRDVNAGAFHIVLINMIGIHSKGFIADVDRFNDIWNQPVTSYKAEIKGEEAVTAEHRMNGIDRRVRVAMVMSYGEELQFWTQERADRGEVSFVSKFPVTDTLHQAFRSKNYEYILELNAGGVIIGGEWVSETRPDFLWTKVRDRKFVNGVLPMAGLSSIYRPVVR